MEANLDEAPIDFDRKEHEPCQVGTIGCCVDHDGGFENWGCETW